jgi:hypothetical protein
MPGVKVKEQPQAADSVTESLEAKILKTFEKPEGFSHLETKSVGKGNFRVNVVTKVYNENSIFPVFARPISWYITAAEAKNKKFKLN